MLQIGYLIIVNGRDIKICFEKFSIFELQEVVNC